MALVGCEPYELTLHAELTRLTCERGRKQIRHFAEGLIKAPLTDDAVLLRGMLDPPADRAVMRAFLALIRAAIVDDVGDHRAAMYSPADVQRRRDNEFLLHADLYLPKRLFLIFDAVPNDGSGASLLLPKARMIAALRAANLGSVRSKIVALLDGEIRADSFNDMFDLLHGDHPWCERLERTLDAAALRICFRRGEGYLIDDRSWLHGRESVHGYVRTSRFHRLVFG